MTRGAIFDIAHISFMDMIKVLLKLSGIANTKGTLIRNAIGAAERLSEVRYDSFQDYLSAIEQATNPITVMEGKATLIEGHTFGLQYCPFSPSINNYIQLFQELPDSFNEFTKCT